MNLGELRDELRQNILHDRSNLTSGDTDVLWSDATLVRYINEAQRRFARRSLCIRDGSTAEVTEVTLATGVGEYALHPSILAIVSCRHEDDNADMVRVGHSALDTYRMPDPVFWDPSTVTTLPDGKPLAYTSDERLGEDDKQSTSVPILRVYPKPSAAYNNEKLKLRVVRLPIRKFTTSNTNMVPEIPEDHHLEMLDWAAYLALRIVDRDAGDSTRAKEFASSFEGHVMVARQAALRKMFAPQQWGFGRNGWSW
jgi:hypothetical protein